MKDVDFRKMPRGLMIQALNIHPETFDAWVLKGVPNVEGEGRAALYDIGKVLEWRVQKEKENKKNDPKPKAEKNKDKDETPHDPDVLVKNKIAEQELRKKIRENDTADGLLVDKKQMEDLFYRLGRNVRDNIISKPQVYGPECAGLSGFEITTYLQKAFEKLCNSLADLNHISDHDLALEYNEIFMAGFNYGKAG